MTPIIKSFFSLSVLCFSNVLLAQNTTEIIFNKNISSDATPALLNKILTTNAKEITKISFEKGTYHFYPDKALESFEYLSNHNDLMVKTAFPIRKFKNLVIDGNGSTFIFHGIMVPFLITDSQQITIKNLIIDWADSFHSEALIVANNKAAKTFDMKIPEKYPYIIRNNELRFIKEYYEHGIGQTILYNPERRAIMFNTEKYTGISRLRPITTTFNLDKIQYKYKIDRRAPEQRQIREARGIKVKALEPGIVRVFGHKKRIPPVGMILTMKGEQWTNRVSPAIRIKNSKNTNIKNVTIHHAGGMGLLAENATNITLDTVHVTPSQGRMVSTTADATHFVGCRGKISIKNCVFENQLDDASNVHGVYQEIVEIIDEYSIGVRMGHFQQQGFQIGFSGDNLGFVRLEDSFNAYGKRSIKNIEYRNGRYCIIHFEDKIPKNVRVGDLLENLDAYPEFLVLNSKIQNNRARGLLLSTPKEVVIRNNFFSTEMEAILIPVESGFWFESGSASNVIIENNIFQDCQHSGFNRGVIRFDTDDDNNNIAFTNIKIRNNTFNHFDNLILQVTNTDRLVFAKNRINSSAIFPQLFPKNPVINISKSRNIELKQNNYQGKSEKLIQQQFNDKWITFD